MSEIGFVADQLVAAISCGDEYQTQLAVERLAYDLGGNGFQASQMPPAVAVAYVMALYIRHNEAGK